MRAWPARTWRLHAGTHDDIAAELTARHGAGPACWTGLDGGLAFDALAARLDHPVYPTGRVRAGPDEEQLRSYAPEFHPRFPLRWLAVPRDAVHVAGILPELWPTPERLGLAGLERSHLALPVHPLTVGPPLDEALRATGLRGRAVLAERGGHGGFDVVPTLSMRTVATTADPALHLKLPLASSRSAASTGPRTARAWPGSPRPTRG